MVYGSQKEEFRQFIIHLHFNFYPCQTILLLRLVREPNSTVCSRFGQQNHLYSVRMRPVLFQNGEWKVYGRVSLQFLENAESTKITNTVAEYLGIDCSLYFRDVVSSSSCVVSNNSNTLLFFQTKPSRLSRRLDILAVVLLSFRHLDQ